MYWDHGKDPALAPADAYPKRLFVRPDPARPAILHIRLLGSPWWSYTAAFRDWLRTDPAGRRAYEAAKDKAARDHAADADFDDYTRAKGAFFDGVQHHYERAAIRPDWVKVPAVGDGRCAPSPWTHRRGAVADAWACRPRLASGP